MTLRKTTPVHPLKRTGRALLVGGLCAGLAGSSAATAPDVRPTSAFLSTALGHPSEANEAPWYRRPVPEPLLRHDRRAWTYPKPRTDPPRTSAAAPPALRAAMAAEIAFTSENNVGGPFDGVDLGNEARPALVDIDADGDFDAFIGVDNGAVSFFENAGSASEPDFAERLDEANPLGAVTDTYSAPAFVDIDGDGDQDAFFGTRGGAVRFFENVGTPGDPAFAERVGGANPLGLVGEAPYVAGSAPAFADLDGDGDQDVAIGVRYSDGPALRYFENVGTPLSPEFVERLDDANPVPPGSGGVGYATRPAFADIDDDGDQDLLIGSGRLNAPANQGEIDFLENMGTPSAPSFERRTSLFDRVRVGIRSTPALADIDGDGDLDVFVGGGGPSYYGVLSAGGTIQFFENRGTPADPAFPTSASPNPFNAVDVGTVTPDLAFADLDGDGDPDAVLEGAFFENVSTPTEVLFVEQDTAFLESLFDSELAGIADFGDLDGDGDQDLLTANGRYFENVGTPTEPAFEERTGAANPFEGLTPGSYSYSAALADIDGDGDLDLFLGRRFAPYASLRYFENTGTASDPAFTEREGEANPLFPLLETLSYGETGFGGFSVDFADVDLDGDLDFAVGDSFSGVSVYENVGTATAPSFTPAEREPVGSVGYYTSPAFADVDGDGDPDLFSSQQASEYGSIYASITFFRNEAAEPVTPPADATPPQCGAIEVETDANGLLVAVETSAFDGESGIARAVFKRLQNLDGFLDGQGPFDQGEAQTFDPATTPRIVIRGNRRDRSKGGAIVVEVTNGDGLAALCDPVLTTVSTEVPEAFGLDANYPNPFNPATTIPFRLAERAAVDLRVYDVTGREVALLARRPMEPGTYEIEWDGRDNAGRPLPSGAYFYRIEAGAFTETRTMTLLK